MSSRFVRCAVLLTLTFLLCASSFAGVRFGGVGIGVGVSYSTFRGPYYGYGPYYEPWGWGPPFYTPAFYLAPDPSRGAVRLLNADKTAEVYINQAYAGVAGDLKTIYLDPGAYDLELRSANKEPQQKRIYVLSGKTLKLNF